MLCIGPIYAEETKEVEEVDVILVNSVLPRRAKKEIQALKTV